MIKGVGNYNLYIVAEMNSQTGKVGSHFYYTLDTYPLGDNPTWRELSLVQ